MKVELQNEIVNAVKTLGESLGLQNPWTLGIGLIRDTISGQAKSPPEIQAAGIQLAGKILGETRLATRLLQKEGEPLADVATLRLELAGLTDAQGIQLRNSMVEFAKIAPPMLKRGMKSYAQTLSSPPGRLPKLTTMERRAVCETILKLQKEGEDLPDAKRRVASDFNVSLPTISRVWRERASLLTRPREAS